MQKSIRQDLSIRIGLVILGISLAIGASYYAYSVYLHEGDFKKSIEHQTTQVANTFTLQLWLFDLNTTRELCKIIVDSPDVHSLTLRDHTQKIIFERTSSEKQKAHEVVSRELRHQSGKLVGYLEIGYSDILWVKQRKDILVIGLSMVFGTLFGALFFINVLLKRHLSKPLDDLQKDMALLAQGDFKQSHIVNQKAEIQNIIDAFNLLTISLHERDKALYEANKIINRSPAVAFIWKNVKGWPVEFTTHNVIKLTGYTHEDFITQKISFSEIIHKDDLQKLNREVIGAAEDKETLNFTPSPYRLITKTGEIKWVKGQSDIRSNGQGDVTHFEGIIYDISDEVRLEKRLQQAQKMEAIGTLAGGIAHDFNNILGVILGYTDMAKDDAPPNSKFVEDLDKVLIAGHRAKDLVAQILAFSRQDEIKRIPIQVQSLIKEALKMLRPTIPSTIDIQDSIDSSCGVVLVDPTQVNQIVMNLCTNATQAMEKTGGILQISLRNVTINKDNQPSSSPLTFGQYVQLTVGDTGTGISPELLSKVFDPYFTTKEVGKGTGMGLAIIHGIIGNYDGAITVESEVGKGTTFHVYFPVVNQEEHPQPIPQREISHATGNILLVDDEELLTEMGKEMLERLGYHVTIHQNSLEALATFQDNPQNFDVVITDQTMPHMTGADLAGRILQIRPDMPIILCTGYSNIIDKNEAKAIGIREFALKPLTKDTISDLLQKVLRPAKPQSD